MSNTPSLIASTPPFPVTGRPVSGPLLSLDSGSVPVPGVAMHTLHCTWPGLLPRFPSVGVVAAGPPFLGGGSWLSLLALGVDPTKRPKNIIKSAPKACIYYF